MGDDAHAMWPVLRMWRVLALVPVLGGAVAVVAFHGHSHGAIVVTDHEGTTAVMQEWRMGASRGEPARVRAGEVTFSFRNTDESIHEFVVVRTDEARELPVRDGRVDLEASGDVVSVSEPFEPGERRERRLTLTPGTYVIFCDMPGHYEGGMYYSLTVE